VLGEQAARHFTTAADLAEELSLRFGLDYRTAYRVVGRAVAAAVERGETELTVDLLTAAAEAVTGGPAPDMADALAATRDPASAVAARDAPGGASPRRVREHARLVRRRVAAAQRWNAGRRASIAEAEAALLKAARDLLDEGMTPAAGHRVR